VGKSKGVDHGWRAMSRDQDRRAPRVPFVAYSEIVADESGTRISTRVSELSLSGCYVDMLNPLPVGTAVGIKIVTMTRSFEAEATVVYSHPNLGVGIAFSNITPYSLDTLRQWVMWPDPVLCTSAYESRLMC
jgi:PilZ domain